MTCAGAERAPQLPRIASRRHVQNGAEGVCAVVLQVQELPPAKELPRHSVSVPIYKHRCWMGHSQLQRGPAAGFTRGYSSPCTQTQEIAVWPSPTSSRQLLAGPATASPTPVPGESQVLPWLAGVSGGMPGLGAGFDRGCVGRVPAPPTRDAEGARRARRDRFASHAFSQLRLVNFWLLV